MKKLISYSILVIICLINVRCNDDEDSRRISFYTDKNLDETSFNRLFIDDIFLANLGSSISNPDCNNESVIHFEMNVKSQIKISLRNATDSVIQFGSISLDDFSDGLSVIGTGKSAGASLNITGSSSDPCTFVQLQW